MYRYLALLSTAAALIAPVPVARVSSAMKAELSSIPGASIECGDTIWDPLELAQWRDVDELRATELANGRAAMLGVVGWLWPQVFGLWQGGSVTTTDPIGALTQVPTNSWIQIIFLCGAIEANKHNYNEGAAWVSGDERDASKVFFDPLGLYPSDAEGQAKMQLRELKNARAAMIAFAGLFVNHFMPGSVPGIPPFIH